MKPRPRLVVAVSGGLDSVVLLDVLYKTKQYELVVAHVDHNVRSTSGRDASHVQELAKSYGLHFEQTKLDGTKVNEDGLRQARYEWLQKIQKQYDAMAIATAHHKDDLVETMIINLLRGTGWRGLSSLANHEEVIRPLLTYTKAELLNYALEHDLQWHEDETNNSLIYMRNRVRQYIGAYLSSEQTQRFLSLYGAQLKLKTEIDDEREKVCEAACLSGKLQRYTIIMLDDPEATEILSAWLGLSLPRPLMKQLILFVKTARPGKRFASRDWAVQVDARHVIAVPASD